MLGVTSLLRFDVIVKKTGTINCCWNDFLCVILVCYRWKHELI